MKIILLSAGHSNTDPGAVYNGLKEADLATELRDLVAFYLREWKVEFRTDGEKGDNEKLNDAIKKARKADIAVEFHFNAATNKSARGIEVLASYDDRVFAQRLAQAIHSVTKSPLRGDEGYKPENAGQHARLGFVQAGGLVVEVEFMSNATALAAYLETKWLVAKALATAIKEEAGYE